MPHIVALLLVLLWSPLSSAKALRYEVTGIKGALKENVEIHPGKLPSIQAGRIDYRRQSIQQAVTQGLQAQGYYQSTIELVVDEQDESLLHVRSSVASRSAFAPWWCVYWGMLSTMTPLTS